MPLAIGTRVGPYEIQAAIGAGSIGEVYRARDTRPHCDVALKVLPASIADHPERLARFRREAHVLAGINHPNIAQIKAFEESGAMHALVMELVAGPTLADRMAANQGSPAPDSPPFKLHEAITIARQIAAALDAAHEQGIIHLDLKPANIKLASYGAVKVLDFGMAEAMDPDERGAGAGGRSIPGTAAYRAPEQAQGKAADFRADVWAFGCVFYELLTGRRAFKGDEPPPDAQAFEPMLFWTQRVEGRPDESQSSECGFPGVEPLRPGLRRHSPGGHRHGRGQSLGQLDGSRYRLYRQAD
jgi:serine/threonine-protein kinase